jgi:hypothetical protein
MMQLRIFVLMLLITAFAGGLAGWAGIEYGLRHATAQDDLDTVLHRDLDLSTGQKARIAALESGFAKDREGYQGEMRAANKDLAHALTKGEAADAEMERAVQRFHSAMAGLQMRTVRHVLSMRSVLTPSQKEIFDRTVDKTLGADSP